MQFRPQGRDANQGLDCIGLRLAAYRLPRDMVRSDYRLRGEHGGEIRATLLSGFRRIGTAQATRRFDASAAASDQLHLAVRTAVLASSMRMPGFAEWWRLQANLNGRSSASIDGACAGSREHRMATLVLTAVGTTLGGPLGGALGSLVGQSIDQQLFGPGMRKGPRLGDLSVQTSSYGSPIPRVYGTMRVAGTVVWATDLQEEEAIEGAARAVPNGLA